ncbi:MAG: TfoX/Sxy family protein, partial [Actinobacteria bacterium]|nr:TfoX/Sxy family protein [Actinomycetota bacterium]
MPFDEGLAQRVRELLEDGPDASERKMFGGLAFMLGGNMCCGIVGDELMVRVGPDGYEAALARPHAREMDFTGRA